MKTHVPLDMPQMSKPPSPFIPAAGRNLLYPKSDGLWYTLNSSGVETPLGGGSVSDTGWVGIPYAANYQDYGVGWQGAQYRILGDMVYLRGMLTRNTSTAPAGSTCAYLPARACPPNGMNLLYEQHVSGARCRVDVQYDGKIIHFDQGLAVGGYLSLSGIFFSTV